MSPLRIASLLIVVLGTVEISPQCVARIFLTGRNYRTGGIPSTAAFQDFNNDGASDIASANGEISVFLNNGDGTFGKANTFAVGEGAADVASADLNGDGNADLVVTDGNKSVNVVLGNGDGTFGSSSRISLHDIPLGIAIADFNGDGILDLAIAIYEDSQVAILIGLGDGRFASPVYYDLTHNGSRLVATDLNHDGKLDLAVAVSRSHAKNALAVLLGNGDGTFQPVVTSVAGSSNDIAAADFNGDGNVDLALVAYLTYDVRVVLGNGDGTFQPATTYSSGQVAFSVATADLSRDGVPDLVVGCGENVAILLGNGDGSFGAAVHYGVGLGFARIGYFNGDRDPDVVAAEGGFTALGVAFGRGDGTLRAPQSFAAGESFDSGDFDGDGNPDIVDGFPLSFLRGLGDGTFAPAVPIAEETLGHLTASDLDGDHQLDLLGVSGEFVFTLLGNGDGTFQPLQGTTVFNDDLWPAVGDFNNDGKQDVALASLSSDQLSILLGNGDGTFESANTYPTGSIPESPVAADFNGDGDLDLAVCNAFGATVGVYFGHGDGTFAAPLELDTFGPVYSAAGDLNQDGNADLVIGGGNGLNLFLANGDGTFQAAQNIYFRYGPVKVADLDRDGRPDVCVSPENGTLVVLRGRNDGTFQGATEYPIGSTFSGFFVLSDLNGDAKPEAIVNDISNYGNSLVVLLNISR